MAITFEGHVSAGGESAGTGTISLPSGWQVGDVAIAQINQQFDATITLPTGWERFAGPLNTDSSCHGHAFWRRLEESEPDPSWTFASSTGWTMTLDIYRNVHAVMVPPFSSDVRTGIQPSGSFITLSSVNIDVEGSMLVAGAGINSSGEEFPSATGMTLTGHAPAGTNHRRCSAFNQLYEAAGSSGDKTFQSTGGDSRRLYAWMVALMPELPPIPPPVITSATALSSTSYRIEWEDGEPE